MTSIKASQKLSRIKKHQSKGKSNRFTFKSGPLTVYYLPSLCSPPPCSVTGNNANVITSRYGGSCDSTGAWLSIVIKKQGDLSGV